MMVEPLRKRTMTLSELQLRTLDVIRKVRFQFQRQGHEPGMSDSEFLAAIIEPLETDIYQDRQMLKMLRRSKSTTEGHDQLNHILDTH